MTELMDISEIEHFQGIGEELQGFFIVVDKDPGGTRFRSIGWS